MALTAWKGPGGGIIISSTPAIIICETCPCACTYSTEVPAGYEDDNMDGSGFDIDWSGVWVFSNFISGQTYYSDEIDFGGGFKIRAEAVVGPGPPILRFRFTYDNWGAFTYPRAIVGINGASPVLGCPDSITFVEGAAEGEASWFTANGPFAAKPELVLEAT